MECGFNLHDTMIWCKDGGGAMGSNLCYTQNIEYMFIWSKGTPKSVHLIRDKVNAHAGTEKSGTGRRKKDGELKKEGRRIVPEYSRRNCWWLVPVEGSDFHPAVFPYSLAFDHIRSWSNEGDTILDPFLGSGTTRRAAYDLNRNFIGFEISKEYFDAEEAEFNSYSSQMSFFTEQE